MSEAVDLPTRPVLGWLGFLTGAVALLVALIVFYAGPFAPQQELSVSLGQLAADTGKSAVRSFFGMAQPDAVPVERTLDDYLQIAVAVLGGLAVILGFAGLIRGEDRRAWQAAVSLGAGAILFQFLGFAIALIACAILIGLFLGGWGLLGG